MTSLIAIVGTLVGSVGTYLIQRSTVTSYRVRWREPDGQERSKTFAKKIEATRFRDVLAAEIVDGQYVDPAAGKISFSRSPHGDSSRRRSTN